MSAKNQILTDICISKSSKHLQNSDVDDDEETTVMLSSDQNDDDDLWTTLCSRPLPPFSHLDDNFDDDDDEHDEHDGFDRDDDGDNVT